MTDSAALLLPFRRPGHLAPPRDDVVSATLRAGVPPDGRADHARLLAARGALYLSTPITGGPEFVDRRIRLGQGELSLTADPALVVVPGVVRRNARRAAALHRLARAAWPDRAIIDPNEMPPKPWTAEQYNRFWGQVIASCVSTAVFADGWELSVGCTFELAVCVELGIPRLDSRLAPLPGAVAEARLAAGLVRLRRASIDTAVAEACLDRLRGGGALAQPEPRALTGGKPSL